TQGCCWSCPTGERSTNQPVAVVNDEIFLPAHGVSIPSLHPNTGSDRPARTGRPVFYPAPSGANSENRCGGLIYGGWSGAYCAGHLLPQDRSSNGPPAHPGPTDRNQQAVRSP